VRGSLLLVEDEPGLALFLSDRLKREGYTVTGAASCAEAAAAARSRHFDLIILDLMLPDGSGLDVCRDLRKAGVSCPVVILTARDAVTDKVVGLKLGADDYVTKPFDAEELLARIEAHLRRAPAPDTGVTAVYRFGDVEVDFSRMSVTRSGRPVDLGSMHLKLLRHLIENRGRVLSRDELLDAVWGFPETVYSRTVDVHVSELRKLLEESPRHPRFILTVHGFGYKFAE
jgi:two-component system, OmpR family, alkaline phosphatase synthesis response regulator PhoP